jgi:hypothetical protein
MSNAVYVYLLLFLLSLGTAAGCGPRRETPAPPPPAVTEPQRGEQQPSPVAVLVEERCSRCHDLTRVYRTREKTAWPGIVSRMVRMSPGLLSAEEQELVVRHLQDNYGE